MRLLLVLPLALLALPALAGPPPAALGVLVDLTRPDETVEIYDRAFPAISAGGQPLAFGETTLEALAQAFGGTVALDMGLGVGLAWLCYLVPTPDGPKRLSFLGLAGEGAAERPVLGLALEPDDPASNAYHACLTAPAALTAPDLGIPALGGSRQQIATRYGIEAPGTPRINIVHQTYEGDTLILQQLQFLLSGDTVTAVALTQSTL